MTDQTWTRTESGGLSDGRGWEVHRDDMPPAVAGAFDADLPWSLWHHGEYVENYATAEEAKAGAVPMDCGKCAAAAAVHRDLELRYVNGRFEVPCACGRVFRGDTPDDAEALANRHMNGEDVPADVDDEPCPSCGARRADCIRVAQSSGGRACCVHCAEAPLADTHRGPRP